MTSPDVIVVGAGVLGLCVAAELAGRGRAVVVIDPGGANASSIAAGMIAPAMESVLDGASPKRADLLRRARDRWPGFAARHGLILHREGAEWRGADASPGRLRALGFAAEAVEGGVFTPDDWRIEPEAVLGALAHRAGVVVIAGGVVSVARGYTGWEAEMSDGRRQIAPHLVIATGTAEGPAGLPEPARGLIADIQPIRGQLTRVETEPRNHVIRAQAIYAVPATGGVLAGATMEPGRRDLTPDQEEAERQARAVLDLLGAEDAAWSPRTGVRGATADGLPMAGPAGAPGLHLALAPRRNGWLVGPWVAAVVADGIEGGTPSADAAALDPLRFTRAR